MPWNIAFSGRRGRWSRVSQDHSYLQRYQSPGTLYFSSKERNTICAKLKRWFTGEHTPSQSWPFPTPNPYSDQRGMWRWLGDYGRDGWPIYEGIPILNKKPRHEKTILHPALRAGKFEPLVWWFDVTRSPVQIHSKLTPTGLRVLASPATNPPQQRLALYCRQFPWGTIEVKNDVYITVQDVFEAIHLFMQEPVWEDSKYPYIGSTRDFQRSGRRVRRRSYWVGPRTIFSGLKEGDGGVWTLKLENPNEEQREFYSSMTIF